jgi:hypothetical protein
MPPAADNITLAIDALALALKTAMESPKPDYEVDGQRVDWGKYISMLTDQMEKLLRMRQDLATPFQLITKARQF